MTDGMRRIPATERARLAPFIERVSGEANREGFRSVFEDAAGRFALGTIDTGTFRAIVGELIRDAAGTAAVQDRDAGTVKVWGTGAGMPRNATKRRARWATWAPDGSGSGGRAERLMLALVMVLSVVALGWIGVVTASHGVTVGTGTGVITGQPNGTPDAERVTVDAGSLPSPDCWFEVGAIDTDGRPGGVKVTRAAIVCP